MRKIIVLTEADRATKNALAAQAAGENLSPEQIRLVAKHNAGRQAGEALTRYNSARKNIESTQNNDGSVKSVRDTLHREVDRSKANDYEEEAVKNIERGQALKREQMWGRNLNVDKSGLQSSKLSSADEIEKRASEGHAKIDSMKRHDLANVRK